MATAVSAIAVDGGELSAVDAYLTQNYYADSDIRYSFSTRLGEQVDCIDFSAQHSVKAFQAQGVALDPANLPPPPSPPTGVAPPTVPSHLAFDGALDQHGNARRCPDGTVPTMRPSVAEIEAAGGLSAFIAAKMRQPRPCGNTCTNQETCFEHDCYLPSGRPLASYEHATGIQTNFSANPYGVLTYMPVYNPLVAAGDQVTSQVWLQTGGCENWFNNPPRPQQCGTGNGVQNQAVQSVEAGYLVNASGAQLFAFITQDGYYTGCFAGGGGSCCPSPGSGQTSDCWVAAPGAPYVVGQGFDQSEYGGQPSDEMAIQVWQGAAHNPAYYGWFVYINGQLIGWYPPNTFIWPQGQSGGGTYGPMSFGPAAYIQTGGEVFDSWPNGQHTTTHMGGGYAPPTFGYGWAGYARNINWITGAGAYQSASMNFYNAPSCELDYSVAGVCGYESGWWTNSTSPGFGAYSLSLTGAPNNNWGSYFFFGGGQGSCKGGVPPPCHAP